MASQIFPPQSYGNKGGGGPSNSNNSRGNPIHRAEIATMSRLIGRPHECEDAFCSRKRDTPRCHHYCASHCCSYAPFHGSDFAKKFARDEKKGIEYLKCHRKNCNNMRVKTCPMYCRDHCCWGIHERRRRQIEKDCRKGMKETKRMEKQEERKNNSNSFLKL